MVKHDTDEGRRESIVVKMVSLPHPWEMKQDYRRSRRKFEMWVIYRSACGCGKHKVNICRAQSQRPSNRSRNEQMVAVVRAHLSVSVRFEPHWRSTSFAPSSLLGARVRLYRREVARHRDNALLRQLQESSKQSSTMIPRLLLARPGKGSWADSNL